MDTFRVGNPLVMSRLANQDNPEGRWGYFHSTIIQEIQNGPDGYIIKTINSVYELKQLNSVMGVISHAARKAGFDPYQDSEQK